MVLSKEKQKSSVFAHFLTTQELNSSGAPNDDFLLNAMKTLFRKSRVLVVILGQLEPFRNYQAFSIIFPKTLDAI